MAIERIFVIVGAVVAVVLQLFLAPYIGVLGAVPSFPVAFAMAVAVARSRSYGCLMPFLLGLAFDFMGGGTVGAMAFSLTAFSVLAARVFAFVDNDSRFMALALMALGLLLVELSYGVFMLVGGYQASLADAFVHRILPCFVYDFVVALLIYPLAARFAKPAGTVRAELTQLR